MFGWTGNVLRVNLTDNTVVCEPLVEQYAYEYIGRRALAMKYHFEECGPETRPFAAENKVVLMTGPVVGTLGIGAAQFSVFAGVPLSNDRDGPEYGDHFGAELKYAGFDGLIIEGSADRPVYLEVTDGRARLLPADELWGLGTLESARRMTGALGSGSRACVIGPAGEGLVPIACAVTDGGTAVGYGGVGAVMGAKKFKGMAVRGLLAVHAAEPAGYIEDILACRRTLAARAGIFRMSTEPMAAVTVPGGSGVCSIKRHKACFSCFIGCRYDVEVRGVTSPCPTPEAARAFAVRCAGGAAAVVAANSRCLDLGLRPEACGRAISRAAESAASVRELVNLAARAEEWGKREDADGRRLFECSGHPEADVPVPADVLGMCTLCAAELTEEEISRQFRLVTGRPESGPREAAERALRLERLYAEANAND